MYSFQQVHLWFVPPIVTFQKLIIMQTNRLEKLTSIGTESINKERNQLRVTVLSSISKAARCAEILVAYFVANPSSVLGLLEHRLNFDQSNLKGSTFPRWPPSTCEFSFRIEHKSYT
ncbi:hypothetical protein CEXT_655331 [Caerostris extrusa]|uniref:Uncharacterized protein n=1 Tax=Caerostris extrusa TaxID=172846 RepID=A0AAV4U3Q0_CAEEX|nr:hypothetical protein CEXT_655331 [Caerostris extrusa]